MHCKRRKKECRKINIDEKKIEGKNVERMDNNALHYKKFILFNRSKKNAVVLEMKVNYRIEINR
jgi:hypothetical protein